MPLTELAASQQLASEISGYYYKPKSWEQPFYKKIGIGHVQSFISGLDLPAFAKARRAARRIKTNNYYLHSTEIPDLKKIRKFGIFNEKVHTGAAAFGSMGILTGGAIYLIEGGTIGAHIQTAASGLLLAGNVSLVMLQRYNRARIDKIIEWKRNR